jgi:hypothetical protein
MGNIITNRNRIIPSGMVPITEHNNILKKLEKTNILLKKTNEELYKYINPIFECCVCYDKNHTHQKKIRCKHQLCKTCYSLIKDKKCPLCRQSMIKYKQIAKYSRYIRRSRSILS